MKPYQEYYAEMVKPGDFEKYRELDIEGPNDDDLYNKITLNGNLADYNIMQIKALTNYTKKQLPGKTDAEVKEFMLRALTNPKTHEILRKHIAYHNPSLFNYIS